MGLFWSILRTELPRAPAAQLYEILFRFFLLSVWRFPFPSLSLSLISLGGCSDLHFISCGVFLLVSVMFYVSGILFGLNHRLQCCIFFFLYRQACILASHCRFSIPIGQFFDVGYMRIV